MALGTAIRGRLRVPVQTITATDEESFPVDEPGKMYRKSWPWKKKSFEKTPTVTELVDQQVHLRVGHGFFGGYRMKVLNYGVSASSGTKLVPQRL